MASNRVLINLEANDNASRVFANMQGNITGAILKANLLGSAFQGAVNLVKSAVGGLSTAIGDASTIEASNISTAGTLMKLIGLNFADATTFIDDFSTKMSVVAATLPGQTKDYVALGKGLMDNLVPAFQELDGTFDKAGFSKRLDSITKNAGFLATSSGTDIQLASIALSKFLGNASSGGLKNLKFFEANPALLGFIQKEADKMGKSLKDLTASERAQVLDAALKVPEEVIKASTISIAGITEGFKSSLFDPQTGIFGLMKDLDDKQAGNQSAYQAIGVSFSLIFGADGTLATLGSIFTMITGIDANSPMEGVRSGFLAFNEKVKFINSALKSFRSYTNTDALINNAKFLFSRIVFDMVGQVNPKRFGRIFAETFNKALPFIATGSPIIINAIMKGVLFLGEMLFNFFTNLDYGRIFQTLGTILSNIDWGNVGIIAFGFVVKGVVLGLASLAIGSAIASTGGAILASVLTVVGLVISAPITLLAAGIVLLVGTLGYVIYNNLGMIQSAMSGMLRGVISFMQPGIDSINRTSTMVGSMMISFGSKMIQIADAFTKFFADLYNLPGTLWKNDIGITPQGTIGLVPSPVANKATGYMPNPLMSAAMRESKQMPIGSSLIIANSSEAIIPRSQQANLLGNNSVGTASLSIGNINITGVSGDPNTIADQVMQAINNKWQQSKNNFSLPSYT